MIKNLHFRAVILFIFFSCSKHKEKMPTPENHLNDGLIAYYPFSNNFNDESGNNYNLANNNATLSSDRFGKGSSAYTFNGTNSYFKIPKLVKADSLNTFTISLWTKKESTNNDFIMSFSARDSTLFCSNFSYFQYSGSLHSIIHQVVNQETPNGCTSAIIEDTLPDPLNKWINLALVQHLDTNNFGLRHYQYFLYLNGKRSSKIGGFVDNPLPTSFSKVAC